MVKFKSIKTGVIIEVTEEHAEQVLRPQGKYIEVIEEPKPEVVIPKVSKKKAKKKTKR